MEKDSALGRSSSSGTVLQGEKSFFCRMGSFSSILLFARIGPLFYLANTFVHLPTLNEQVPMPDVPPPAPPAQRCSRDPPAPQPTPLQLRRPPQPSRHRCSPLGLARASCHATRRARATAAAAGKRDESAQQCAVSKAQITKIQAAVREAGFEYAEIKAKIYTAYKIESLKDLPANKVDDCLARIHAAGDKRKAASE